MYVRSKYNIYTEEEYKIIKQMDSELIEKIYENEYLEFVCDAIVYKYNDSFYVKNIYPQMNIDQLRLEMLKYYNLDFYVYGAIWTDVGLIYKARMNEEGELELI